MTAYQQSSSDVTVAFRRLQLQHNGMFRPRSRPLIASSKVNYRRRLNHHGGLEPRGSADNCAIKDWDLLHLHQRYFCIAFAKTVCSAGITDENEFRTSSSPALYPSNDVTSGHAHTLYSEI